MFVPYTASCPLDQTCLPVCKLEGSGSGNAPNKPSFYWNDAHAQVPDHSPDCVCPEPFIVWCDQSLQAAVIDPGGDLGGCWPKSGAWA